MSKVCSAVMVRKISATMIEGISIGIVICQNCCQRVAPSTSAASYSERGIICSPASRISAMKADVFQTMVAQIAVIAQPGRQQPHVGVTPQAQAAQHVVDHAVLGVEEPREDQAGEGQRQRPGQQQRQPHRPAALERQVGQHRQAQAHHQRARAP
jgi:hypothetical protein